MINISIIIPHLLDDDWLRVTIRMLNASLLDGLTSEIIIVDNGREIPVDLTNYGNNIKVIHRKEVLGTSEARMIGGREAIGEILIFTDSHVLMNPSTLMRVYILARREKLVTVYCKGLCGEHMGKGGMFTIHENKPWLDNVWNTAPAIEGMKTNFLGAFYVIAKEIFDKVYFNPVAMCWGGDEIFPSLRMATLNISSYFTPSITIEHLFKNGPIPKGYENPTKPFTIDWNNYSANLIHFPGLKEYFLSNISEDMRVLFIQYESEKQELIKKEIEYTNSIRTIDEKELWKKLITPIQNKAKIILEKKPCNCGNKTMTPNIIAKKVYPKISAYCPTYGRPLLLEESIESFLRQDYKGDKELIILNDCNMQTLTYKHPQIKIVNTKERIIPFGHKFNEAVSLCRGDILMPWGDDDIQLPHRMSYSVEHLKKDFFHTNCAFIENKNHSLSLTRNSFWATAAYTKKLFDLVDGFPEIDSRGEDVIFLTKIKKLSTEYISQDIPPELLFFIYRWSTTDSYHASGFPSDLSLRVGKYIEKQINEGKIPKGDYVLNPHWNFDYLAMKKQFLIDNNLISTILYKQCGGSIVTKRQK